MNIKIPKKNTFNYEWINYNKEIIIINNNGNIRIYNSICPHMGAKLYYNFDNKCLTCPWHGLEYNTVKFISNSHIYKKIKEYKNFIIIEDKLQIKDI
jgi:Rieske Fe-S protein